MPTWVERRRWERQDSDMACTIEVNGSLLDARIRNVSLGGALIDGVAQLARLTPVVVKTETGRTLRATVMWWRDQSVGVKFDQQLMYNDALITPKSD
ncbi:MAG TPA: PilZ domain-containing protein [Hyphomicrobium sp.]|nr:PilZ domain-containing protein [Hyphomicrobium sp.]